MFTLDKDKVKSANLFLGGLALGTAGIRLLTSKDAKKLYANIVAAGLRAKDNIMDTVECVKTNTDDILAEAYDINEQRNDELFEEMDSKDTILDISEKKTDTKKKKTTSSKGSK